jgi:hypothetical protein
MDIEGFKAKLWGGRGRAVMPGAVLDVCRGAATDAGLAGVTRPYPGVERVLRVLEVVRPALQLLLAYLDLPALDLGQSLTLLLLLCPGNGNATVR